MKTKEIKFFVKGDPVAWQRVRYNSRSGNFFTAEHTRDWEGVVAAAALGKKVARLMSCPVRIELIFFMGTPKKHKKFFDRTGKLPHHTNKPDVDNLVKAVKDALRGIMYNDDSQIYDLKAQKFYAHPEPPGVGVILQYEILDSST